MIKRFEKLFKALKGPAIALLKDESVEEFYLNETLPIQKLELEDLYEHTPFPQFWLSAEGKILWANSRVLKLLGVPKVSFVEQNFLTFLSEDDQQKKLRSLLIQREDITDFRCRLKGKSGFERSFLLYAHPAFTQNEFIHYRVFIEEVNPATAHTEAPKESPSFLNRILDKSPNGIMTYRALRNESGKIFDFECVYANAPSQRFTALAKEKAEGMLLSQVWANCNPESIINRQAELVENNLEYRYERQYEFQGASKWFFAVSSKFEDGYTITFEDITERREAELLLSKVIENTHNGLLIFQPVFSEGQIKDFEIVLSNVSFPAFKDTPWLKGSLLSQLDKTLLPEPDFSSFVSIWESGSRLETELLFDAGENAKRLQLSLSKNDDVLCLVFRDITENEQAKDKLQTANALLHEAQSLAKIATWEYDYTKKEIVCSDELFDLLEIKKGVFIPTIENFFSIILTEDLDKVHSLGAFLENGESSSVYLRLKTGLGAIKTFACKARLIKNQKGEPHKIVGIMQDVQEKIEAEARTEAIFNASPNALYHLEAIRDEKGILTDFRYERLNNFCAQFTGRPNEYYYGKKISDLYQDETYIQKLKQVVETGISQNYEFNYNFPMGERIAYVSTAKFGDGVICSLIDITERVKTESVLRSVLDSSPNFIHTYKAIRDENNEIKDFEFTLVNRSLNEIIPSAPSELVGKRLLEIEDELAWIKDLYEKMVKVVQSGVSINYDLEYTCLDTKRWFNTTLAKLQDGLLLTFSEVTYRKTAEEKLKNNELFIRQITNTAPSLICVYEPHSGNYLFISEAAQKLLGYSQETLMKGGLNFMLSLVHPDDLESLLEKNDDAMAKALTADKELVEEFEYRVRHQNGHYIWLHTSGIIFKRDEKGQIDQLLNVSIDITERKEAEEKLSESQHLLEQIMQNTPNMLYVFDIQSNRMKFINKEVESMLGYLPEDLIRLEEGLFQKYFHPEDLARLWKSDRVAIQRLFDHEVAEFEYRLLHQDGSWRWMHTRERVFKRDAAGKVIEILGIAEDITQKRAQAEEFRQLTESLENAMEGISMIDEAGIYTKVNAAKEHLVGCGTPLIGRHWLEIVHPLDREKAREHLVQMKTEGKSSFELRLQRKDGTFIYAEYTLVANYPEINVFKGSYLFVKDISERKRHEQFLLENKVKFEIFFNQTFQLLSILTPEGKIIETNAAALNFHQPSQVSFFQDLPVHADPARIAEFISRSAGGQVIREEITAIDAKGNKRVLDFSLKPVRDEDDTIIWLVAEGKDITERKNSEEELLKSRHLLAQAEQMAHHGSWEWDVINAELTWSDELYRIYGFDPQEETISYEKYIQCISPADRERVGKIIEGAKKAGSDFAFEHQIKRPTGETRIVSAKGKVIQENNQVVKMIGSSVDITEQKLAYERLLNSQELYKTLAGNMPDSVVFLFDNHLNISLADGASLEGLNLSRWPEEKHLPTLFEDPAFQEIVNVLEEVFDGHEKNMEMELFGTIYKVDIIPVKNVDGSITSGILVLRDFTEIKKYQDELELRINDLNRSNKNLEQFAYVASHDLQEPLRKIRTFGGRLTDKYGEELGSEGKDFLHRMQNAAERMQIMIDDLLSYSRLSRGDQPFVATSLTEVIQNILSDFEITIENKKAEIHVNKLPSVDAMPGQMQQLFQNLISNSLKFSKPDKPPVISIGYETLSANELPLLLKQKHQRYCKITVQDNGIGFDQRYAERIFTIFQRLHGRSDYAGTGIGLAICKKIVENHGGEISVQSQEGEGTTFSIIIPFKHKSSQQQLALSLN